MQGLFGYGYLSGDGIALPDTPYVVIDLETTGLAADEDRIVEIAMGRVENGVLVDEWATLIDPQRDPGPTFLHHISAGMLDGAPTFREIAGEILARLDGAVVVAHNAAFEEGFLQAELARIGVTPPPIPALCTLIVSRLVLASPNYRLATCCEITGTPLDDAHTALGDVRATAILLPKLLSGGASPRYPVAPVPLPKVPSSRGPRTRVTNLRKGETGWMSSLLAKLPYSMDDHDPVGAEPYLDALGEALADGRLTGEQTRRLGRLAGRAGMGAAQVAGLHQRFLDALRDAALGDGPPTASEYRQLTTAAQLLNLPDYFADVLAPDGADVVEKRRRGPRVWCSPRVPAKVRTQLEDAGYLFAVNITRTVVAAVVAEGDERQPKAVRSQELGVRVLTPERAAELLRLAEEERAPLDLPAPSAPAGWYPDPTGRNMYRYWDGTLWTAQVSPGSGAIVADPLSR
ncbi:exonuclease domain-containing protein [Hamadaea tsunoensis]|uniref:exonuclease domain-containing protein n=1 Tax=Hamadaea tsunoensis TaxID=53368 RepID=UPI0003FBE3AC|nr:exonuclease domain-containing protein [Hamadaea tsunoensis]